MLRHKTFGCVAMGNAVLFILMFGFLIYSSGSGVSRMQVVMSEMNLILLCFVQAKTICRFIFFLAALVVVCVDVDADVIIA